MTVINLSVTDKVKFDNYEINSLKLIKQPFENFIPRKWHVTTIEADSGIYTWLESNTNKRYKLVDTGVASADYTKTRFIIGFEDEDDMIIFKMLH